MAKVNLGKVLFWDEQLSSTRTVACATCHIPAKNGSDPRSVFGSVRATHPGPDGIAGNSDDIIGSPGVIQCDEVGFYVHEEVFGLAEQVTTRKAPSALNAGYAPRLFWDGRAAPQFRDPVTNALLIPANGALETQAAGPPPNTVEMGHLGRDWNDVAAQLEASWPLALSPQIPPLLQAWMGERDYPALFAEAFGSANVTPARIIMAIASYERTLVSNQAPVDFDTQQNPTLTQQEQQGRQIFIRSDCNGCHAGNRFTDDQFHYTGVRPVTDDLGRFNETSINGDRGAMKTPGLRNIELNAPYMHDGRFATLEAVVDFYDRGGDFNAPNRDNRIRPLNLTQNEKAALVAFLRRPLTDPRVASEQPPFDRPTLYTESDRVPRIEGFGVAGTGGHVPRPIANEPPLAGNPSFTLGIANALGGAAATLVIDSHDPGVGAIPADGFFVHVSIGLDSAGAGNGRGSVGIPIPPLASLVGQTFFGRWYVADAAGPGGFAISPLIRFTVFGDRARLEPDTPEGETIDGEIAIEGEAGQEGEAALEGELESEGETGSAHHCDIDRDYRISLSELLRLIQIYRVGGLHCEAATEDGFGIGAGDDTNCPPHASDYAPQDWSVSLAELLRAIQLFGAGAYHACVLGEDGYCPGTE